MKRSVFFLSGMLTAVMILGGCGQKPDATASVSGTVSGTEQKIELYSINQNGDQLVSESYHPRKKDTDSLIAELTQVMTKDSGDKSRQPLLPQGVKIRQTTLKDGVLQVDLNRQFLKCPDAEQLLIKAGIVRTYTQISEISYVELFIEGKPLTDSAGKQLGRLNDDSFVENAAKSIHSYTSASMKLYFTNQKGTELVPQERNVYYNSNEALEMAVVEQVLNGPGNGESGSYPTFPDDITVLSVVVQEGICYVNFNKNFQNLMPSVKPEIQLYSIVNSLSETCSVKKVQFLINGKSNVAFGGISLDQLFKPDLTLSHGK